MAEQPGEESSERTSMRRRATSPVARVVLLACVLSATTVLALLAVPGGTAAPLGGGWWIAGLLVLGYVVAEKAVFHIEHRTEAITVSLSEVPTLFALLHVDLRVAIACRVVGGLLPVWWARRSPHYKVLLNASVFALETAVAGLAMRVVLDPDASHAAVLVVGAVAVAVGSAIGSAAVLVAIAQFEGSVRSRLQAELVGQWWTFGLTASIAALIVAPSLVDPWLTPLAFGPLGAFWLFFRRYASLDQALRDVRALHGFAGRVSGATDLDEIGRVAVTEACDLLRARGSALYVGDGTGLRLLATTGDIGGLPAEPWADAEPSHRPDWCAAPFSTDAGVVGVLAITGRRGVVGAFTTGDLERLRTIADQLAAPVARGVLHRQLEHEARHDQLTGLANRGSFERAVAERLEHGGPITFVAILDLDRFKEVNDTLGHHAGDVLLVEVADRLRSVAAADDALARFAGDEFGIAGCRPTVDEIDDTIRACSAALGRSYSVSGLEIVVNVSVGVATRTPGLHPTPDTTALLRRADIAMYHAKQHHLGHDHYRPEIDRRTPARLSLLADLRSAIERGDIRLHFQPKIDLATGVVCGAEVLARWQHPTRGTVPPADFVAVAEQSGLIRPLTDHVLVATVQALAALDRLGHDVPLAMNLSVHDLIDELLCDRIEHRLDQHGVAAGRLTLEITESTLFYDSPRTRANLDRLHRAGIAIAIDDFGTGYSSLSSLRQLPVSELKIDRSFVSDLLVDAQDETIVHSTIDLGHHLGLRVVAEGVESEAVGERLRDLGCDVAQGYGICRPVSFDRFTEWLAAASVNGGWRGGTSSSNR